MGCCVGEKHSNWCEDYDIVYIDAEGKEYCIFHAPAECKFVELYDERDGGEKPALMVADEFNGLVFARIDGVIEAGKQVYERAIYSPKQNTNNKSSIVYRRACCDFVATIFSYPISFSQYNSQNNKYIPPINFSYSTFNGLVEFAESEFRGNTDFKRATFCDKVLYKNSIFWGDADFSYSRFKGQFLFYDSKIQRNADFSQSQFYDSVDVLDSNFFGFSDFQWTVFSEETFITSSNFHGSTEFIHANFQGTNYFGNSQFEGYVDFFNANFEKKTEFNETQFQNDVFFINTTFSSSLIFNNTTFLKNRGSTSFNKTHFNDYVIFDKTTFKSNTSFKRAFFKEWSHFRNSKFLNKISFTGAISKETILIESVDLSNFKFAETNIESFKFIDCKWGDERFAPIYDEKHQTENNCNDTTLAGIYRRLKKIARESADEEQTSHWHYREKEMQRRSVDSAFFFPTLPASIICIFLLLASYLFNISKNISPSTFNGYLEYFMVVLVFGIITVQYINFKFKNKNCSKSKNWFSKIYLNIYHTISGYGENPIRAGILLSLLIAIPFCIQFTISYTTGTPSDWLKSAMWYMPLIKIDLYNTQGYHYLLKGISVTTITLQAALFGFALRNKLRR